MNSICGILDYKLSLLHKANLFDKFKTKVSNRVHNQLVAMYNKELLSFAYNQLHDQIRANLKRS